MATITSDARRSDERSNVRLNPFWLTSALVDTGDLGVGDEFVLLFSFPAAKGTYVVHETLVEVTEKISGGTGLVDIGKGTMQTDSATTFTMSDASYYIGGVSDLGLANASVATGWYSAKTNDAYVQAKHTTTVVPIVGSDTAANVPCIGATIDGCGVSGKFKLKLLVSRVDQ